MNLEKRLERIDILKNSVRFKNNKRILRISHTHTWMVYDCGCPLNAAARDYTQRLNMLKEFQERYNFDAYIGYWNRNPSLISDRLGASLYELCDKNYGVNFRDVDMLNVPHDYEVLLRDYKEFLWTCVMPKKFSNLTDSDAVDKLNCAMAEYEKYQEYNKSAGSMMKNEFGVFALGGKSYFPMFENLMKNWRGMRGLSRDLRKNSELLEQIATKYFFMGSNTNSYTPEETYGSDPDDGSDISISFLSHTLLNTGQFEKFLYPCLKYIYEYAEKYDKIIRFNIQGESERLWEYFQDAPKGHFIFQLESDDIFKAKKVLGTVACLAGGMPCSLLGTATPDQCVDYAKKLLDEVGYDGAYIFTSDKMMCFPNDCKRENLLAVLDYVENARLS